VNEAVHNLPVQDDKLTAPEQRSTETVAELVSLAAEKGERLREKKKNKLLKQKQRIARKREANDTSQSLKGGEEAKDADKTKDRTGDDDASSLGGRKGRTKKTGKKSGAKSEKGAAEKSKQSAKKAAKTPASQGLVRRYQLTAKEPGAATESAMQRARKIGQKAPAFEIRKIQTLGKTQLPPSTESTTQRARKIVQKNPAWDEAIRKIVTEAKPEDPSAVNPFLAADKKWPAWSSPPPVESVRVKTDPEASYREVSVHLYAQVSKTNYFSSR
jgi:hypothetical protein